MIALRRKHSVHVGDSCGRRYDSRRMVEGCLFEESSPLIEVIERDRLPASPSLRRYDPSSSNDYHSVVMVVVMMMTPTMVAIRLRISRSREEGKESKDQ